jgi:hypothetical protein
MAMVTQKKPMMTATADMITVGVMPRHLKTTMLMQESLARAEGEEPLPFVVQ